jgi:hypothetical protein
MTKIGEGKSPVQPSDEMYHKNLEHNLLRFENALSSYQVTKNPEEMEQLRDIMNQQMSLVVSSIREIKIMGIQKQGEKVQADYNHYKNDPSLENLTTLQQDLSTLEQFNAESSKNTNK